MKITVLGAGSIGAAVTRDLARHPDVSLVQVCDARARALSAVDARTLGGKVRAFQVDARDPLTLRPILEGSDCIVASVPSAMSPPLARLALDLGIAFVDMGGPDTIVDRLLALDGEARERGVWIVPNCGITPGLVNVLCLHGIEQFDHAEAAQVRVGDVPAEPREPFRFAVSWSVEKLIDDYTSPVEVVRDGERTTVEPLSDLETVCFEAPYDRMEAFHAQGGQTPLTRVLAGRVDCLDHKLVRWPGHADQMRFLLALGLADDRTIDVRTHLTYRDVLLRSMRQHIATDEPDVLLLRVLVRGTVGGAARTLVYELQQAYDHATSTTAIRHATAVATTALVAMLGRHAIPGGGAAPPELVVDPGAYLDAVRAAGLDVRETWYDGHRRIESPEG